MPVKYYRFTPVGTDAPAHNLLLGEVEAGGVYEVPEKWLRNFEGQAEWEPVTKRDFDTQD